VPEVAAAPENVGLLANVDTDANGFVDDID